ncbi:aa3-type cytochrome c oxidase subunit IV [uncultured Rhodoblastus sp.]|uniref:aa3-type cytochrome c oxidase subunit IV n=1 Tax=uncultured Rhodoblastus sp. TaxID=543037 RepID=UPI0025D8445E|nr:aa3-type cytochrome c oxidase subunit IV [uncultured Rhodoblastus sp.]
MAADQLTAGDHPDGHASMNYSPAMDYAAHVATYRFFIDLLKWATIGVVLAVLLLAYLTL